MPWDCDIQVCPPIRTCTMLSDPESSATSTRASTSRASPAGRDGVMWWGRSPTVYRPSASPAAGPVAGQHTESSSVKVSPRLTAGATLSGGSANTRALTRSLGLR